MWRSFIRRAEPTDKIKDSVGGTDRAFDCVKGEFPDLLISRPDFSIRTFVAYNKVSILSITILQ